MRFAACALLVCTLSLSAQQLRGVPVENLDRSVNPCNDFEAFAVGGWRKTHPMPERQATWAIRSVTQDDTWARLRTIAEDDMKKTSPKGSPAQLTGDFYGACMDDAAINSAGLKPLEPMLHAVDSIRDVKALNAAMVTMAAMGMDAPVGEGATQDSHDTTKMIAEIQIGGLGMPDRDYYLRDEARFKHVREEYMEYMKKMYALAGENAEQATTDSAAVMKIETALAQARMSRVELRDPKATDHPTTFAELKTLAPHYDWDADFKAKHIPTTGHMNVGQPKVVQAFDGLLTSVSLAEWKAYLRWHLLDGNAASLADNFEETSFAFRGTVLSGTKEQRPRWQRCVITTDRMLGEALGHEYVDRYLPPEAKARARTMAVNIVNELKLSIQTRDWMTAETKTKALEKVNALNIKIGYPDKWKTYEGVVVKRDTFLENVISARRYSVRDDLQQIGKPVDRGRWDMTPPTMNAYYNPLMNEVVVPAGYLQPPGFDPKGLDAINYGAVGVSIGHEISHGVDDEGAQYAADGRLLKWWTDADYKNFTERTACTTKQYDNYFVEPGLHLQGKLVTGEALGDLGGVNLAFRAYERSREGKGPEPTVDGLTPEQQFFLAEGQWRGALARPEMARTAVSTDPHPPGRYRVLGPLSNMPEFDKAFACKEGDAMVRPAAEQCSVW
ncbi:M13 family metallopeptidase [Terriglobus roseus]|uniref:Endothelin-converting enzyme/putative endopeptidase n=1 Tax=Terriglobus roseus TaxID=392734 RepID=A0A1G7QTF5_9BACT|nr:M13 family metallopeptidase [Terriglobus roseus]SDG01808.1 endothelin-converting enzyme/putative endopeptidase [Terriglobus roseus]